MRKRYGFELLFKHSNETAQNTRVALKDQVLQTRSIFGFLDYHFTSIENETASHTRNVKLALTTRFINHLFSTLLLAERGLILDAFNCFRSAIETTAFYWLVCHDNGSATIYDAEKSPSPVEVRKRLETHGVDIQAIRDLYSLASAIAHVGNPYDQLQIRWEREKDGRLLVGGGSNPDLQKAIFQAITLSVFRFVRFDENYIVSDIDNIDTAALADPKRIRA